MNTLNVTDHFSTGTASECKWVVPEDEYRWAQAARSSDRLVSVPNCGVGSASRCLRTSCHLCTELHPGSGYTSSEDTFKVNKITVLVRPAKWNMHTLHRGLHSSVDEDSSLLGCDAVLLGKQFQKIRMIVTSSSGSSSPKRLNPFTWKKKALWS
jgi:hypothetical protein